MSFIMNVNEKTKSETFLKHTTEKKPSRWNGKKILEKLSNVRKSQKNKVAASEITKRPGNGLIRFRSLVAKTKAVYRAPKFITINLETPKVIPENTIDTTQMASESKLKTNILSGDVKIKSVYEADIPSINAMCSSGDNSILIGCWNRNPIYRLKYSDNIESVENFDTSVSDMTMMPSGDILFTKFGDCAIKHLSRKDGSITTFRGCMPLHPEGISMTRSGDILVTVVDETSFLVNKSTKRKVLKLNRIGKLIKDIEYGPHGLKLFILPYRVTENINGDICVVNRTGRYLGQVVVLNQDGEFKFTYDGNPNFPCNDFIPMGIACDNNGCIIVTDPNDFSIHILDKTGILIQYLSSTKIGMGPPLSVCVDNIGALWVGCTTEGSKHSNRSKVYALS